MHVLMSASSLHVNIHIILVSIFYFVTCSVIIEFAACFQILGFFFAGIVLNQFGFIRNLTDVKVLSEWGILFLVRKVT